MSLKTWKKEFYPTTAKQVARNGDLAAVEHSLRKWQGATPVALKQHGLVADNGFVTEENTEIFLAFNGDTCAMCVRWLVESMLSNRDACSICPLAIVRGGTSCSISMEAEADSPYHAFCNHNDPKPMLHWLRKARAYVLAHPRRR